MRPEPELVHEADLAVYRAKLQGRNRVVGAGPDSSLVTKPQPLASVPGVEVSGAPTRAHKPFIPVAVPEQVVTFLRPTARICAVCPSVQAC